MPGGLSDGLRCEVRPTPVGMGAFATQPLAAGDWAIELAPVFDDRPGRHTIQVDAHRHQAFTDELDDFINHSCEPSVSLDAWNLQVVARRPIAVGEEITLNYSASEWDMAEPFVCTCDGTAKTIRGFRHLSVAEQLLVEDLVPGWLWARRAADR